MHEYAMNTHRIFKASLLCLACLVLFLFAGSPDESTAGVAPDSFDHERFFRAAFILKSLDNNARNHALVIPARTVQTDATESLLHHPDRIFVLRTLASELAAVQRTVPKALLYEAFARLALGEKPLGAELLARYVGETEYDAAQYRLLCRTLSEIRDYSTLHIICREWTARADGAGLSKGDAAERASLGWEAMHGLRRYAEARHYVLKETKHLGWRASVYAAQSSLAQGDEAGARQLINEAINAHKGSETEILRLWENVSSRTVRE